MNGIMVSKSVFILVMLFCHGHVDVLVVWQRRVVVSGLVPILARVLSRLGKKAFIYLGYFDCLQGPSCDRF